MKQIVSKSSCLPSTKLRLTSKKQFPKEDMYSVCYCLQEYLYLRKEETKEMDNSPSADLLDCPLLYKRKTKKKT